MAQGRLITKIDDWTNPIAVKEMRQAVKGNFISWILMLFMLIQLTIIGAVLLFNDSLGTNFNLGRSLFMGLLSVMLGVCMLFLPALAAMRMVSERSDKNVDLFFITTLTPFQIIWGKMSVSLLLTLLFFSASLPFMTLTYLLRGIDLPTMFILMGLDFLIVAAAIQFGVMLASFRGGMIRRGVSFLIGLGALFMMFIFSMQASAGMLFMGLGGSFGTWDFWGPALTTVFFILMSVGAMLSISVASITPSSANKAFFPRIYLFCAWLLSGIVAGSWAIAVHEEDIIVAWKFTSVFIFCLKFFVAICEREEFGPRLRKTIPQNLIVRPFYYLFSSGAASGILYTVILMVLTLVIGFGFADMKFPSSIKDEEYAIPIAFATYALGYCLLGLLIKRKFFANSTVNALPAIITIFLCCGGTVIPAVIGFMVKSNPHALVDEVWYTGSPFVLFYDENLIYHCILFSSVITVALSALSLPWFIRQFAKFKSLPKLISDELIDESNAESILEDDDSAMVQGGTSEGMSVSEEVRDE